MSDDSRVNSIMDNDLNNGCSIEVDGEVIDSGIAYENAYITCIAIAEAMHDEGKVSLVQMFLPGAIEPKFETTGHTFDLVTGKCSCGEIDHSIPRAYRQ